MTHNLVDSPQATLQYLRNTVRGLRTPEARTWVFGDEKRTGVVHRWLRALPDAVQRLSMAEIAAMPNKPTWIERALSNGDTIARFVPTAQVGAKVAHLRHWLRDLEATALANDPKDGLRAAAKDALRGLQATQPDVALKEADAWFVRTTRRADTIRRRAREFAEDNGTRMPIEETLFWQRLDASDLKRAGQRMQNCLARGYYMRDVQHGSNEVWALFDGEAKDDHLVAVTRLQLRENGEWHFAEWESHSSADEARTGMALGEFLRTRIEGYHEPSWGFFRGRHIEELETFDIEENIRAVLLEGEEGSIIYLCQARDRNRYLALGLTEINTAALTLTSEEGQNRLRDLLNILVEDEPGLFDRVSVAKLPLIAKHEGRFVNPLDGAAVIDELSDERAGEKSLFQLMRGPAGPVIRCVWSDEKGNGGEVFSHRDSADGAVRGLREFRGAFNANPNSAIRFLNAAEGLAPMGSSLGDLTYAGRHTHSTGRGGIYMARPITEAANQLASALAVATYDTAVFQAGRWQETTSIFDAVGSGDGWKAWGSNVDLRLQDWRPHQLPDQPPTVAPLSRIWRAECAGSPWPLDFARIPDDTSTVSAVVKGRSGCLALISAQPGRMFAFPWLTSNGAAALREIELASGSRMDPSILRAFGMERDKKGNILPPRPTEHAPDRTGFLRTHQRLFVFSPEGEPIAHARISEDARHNTGAGIVSLAVRSDAHWGRVGSAIAASGARIPSHNTFCQYELREGWDGESERHGRIIERLQKSGWSRGEDGVLIRRPEGFEGHLTVHGLTGDGREIKKAMIAVVGNSWAIKDLTTPQSTIDFRAWEINFEAGGGRRERMTFYVSRNGELESFAKTDYSTLRLPLAWRSEDPKLLAGLVIGLSEAVGIRISAKVAAEVGLVPVGDGRWSLPHQDDLLRKRVLAVGDLAWRAKEGQPGSGPVPGEIAPRTPANPKATGARGSSQGVDSTAEENLPPALQISWELFRLGEDGDAAPGAAIMQITAGQVTFAHNSDRKLLIEGALPALDALTAAAEAPRLPDLNFLQAVTEQATEIREQRYESGDIYLPGRYRIPRMDVERMLEGGEPGTDPAPGKDTEDPDLPDNIGPNP